MRKGIAFSLWILGLVTMLGCGFMALDLHLWYIIGVVAGVILTCVSTGLIKKAWGYMPKWV
jgi:predicted transporter